MKNFVLLTTAALLILTSCSRKTTPTVSTPATRTETAPQTTVKVEKEKEITLPETLPHATTTAPEPAPLNFSAPMIVIDEAGKIVTPKEKLPEDIAEKVDYKKISHAFTLEQRKNLIYRFKMVPPRVLFVPENLASKSARGTYVVYKKKFWYWKKGDALFHLDETYYQ